MSDLSNQVSQEASQLTQEVTKEVSQDITAAKTEISDLELGATTDAHAVAAYISAHPSVLIIAGVIIGLVIFSLFF